MTEEEFIPILDKMVRYCSYSERCHMDVDLRLHKLNVPAEIKQKIIDYLHMNNLIDEQRYALSFAESKLRNNKWGRIKIRRRLKDKQLDSPEIDRALGQLDETEYRSILEHVLVTKYEMLNGVNDRVNKTVRYAQSKGFELSLIFEMLKDLEIMS